ncbi:MAG TPA: TonB-dependent receptor [bacterium]|nr:TonB-dependent receptor [bacterium]
MRQNLRCYVLSAVISFGIPFVGWAADDPPIEPVSNTSSGRALMTLPEVVVTANRLDMPLSQVTSSMTVIIAQDMEQKQNKTLRDALQDVPGLESSQYGGSGQISPLFTRGANGENTLVMMDGIPLNNPINPSYSYDYLDQLTLDGLRQVEVVRGPQSALYGSNAMAGVVNLVSGVGGGPLRGSLSFEGGSYGTFRENAEVLGGDATKSFTLALSRLDSAGFPIIPGGSVNNGNQNITTAFKGEAQLTSSVLEELLLRNSISHTSLDAYDPYTYLFHDDPSYYVDQKQMLLGSRTHWTLDPVWEQVWGLSYMENTQTYDATPNSDNAYYQQGTYFGQEAQVDWQNNLRLSEEETLVAGLQGKEQWGNSTDTNNGYYDSFYNVITLTDRVVNAQADQGSLYVSSQTHLADRFFANLGGRVDLHSQFGSHGTYQGGVAYIVPGVETKLKGNVGTGFMAPNLYQLNDPNYGNKDLKPEENTAFDLGFEQPIGKNFQVGTTYFHNDFTDLISFDPKTFRNANINQAQSVGWESFLSTQPLPGLRLGVNYTYLWIYDVQTGVELSRRPQNQGGLNLFYTSGGFEGGVLLVYMGDRLDYDYVNFVNIINPEYFLVNLRASLKIEEHLQLFARVDNLGDRVYQEIYGYAMPRRSAFLGTKLSF